MLSFIKTTRRIFFFIWISLNMEEIREIKQEIILSQVWHYKKKPSESLI